MESERAPVQMDGERGYCEECENRKRAQSRSLIPGFILFIKFACSLIWWWLGVHVRQAQRKPRLVNYRLLGVQLDLDAGQS